jgi:hypothetical protein
MQIRGIFRALAPTFREYRVATRRVEPSRGRMRSTEKCILTLLLSAGPAALSGPVLASEPLRLDLSPLWQQRADADWISGQIVDVTQHPEGAYLLLDQQLSRVHVLDERGDLLRSIGREGEGPGEFRRAASIFSDVDGSIVVVQSVPIRLVRFTLEGEPVDDLPFDDGLAGFRALATMVATSSALVFEELQTSFGAGAVINTTRLVHFDRRSRERSVIAEHVHAIRTDAGVVHEREISHLLGQWALTTDGAIVHVADFADHRARRVPLDGGRVVEFERAGYEPVVRDDATLQRLVEQHASRRDRLAPRGRLRFEPSPVAPALVAVFAREDGSVWLQRGPETIDTAAPRPAIVFDHFDAAARFLGEVWVHGDVDLNDHRLRVFGEVLVAIPDSGSDAPGVSAWTLRARGD